MKTIKIICLSALVMTFVATLKAQTGFTVGTNISNLYVDNVDDENAKVGLNIGIYSKHNLASNLGIQYEFLYSQNGAALQYDNFLSGSGTYRFNLNYIKVPVMLTGNIGKFNIHAGPYVGFLVDVKIKDVDGDGSINSVQELDRDDFNTLDYGMAAGLGYDFDGGILGIRYNYGFKEIGKSGSFAGDAASDAKNSALTLYVGFHF
jgi:hypothetical protein